LGGGGQIITEQPAKKHGRNLQPGNRRKWAKEKRNCILQFFQKKTKTNSQKNESGRTSPRGIKRGKASKSNGGAKGQRTRRVGEWGGM